MEALWDQYHSAPAKEELLNDASLWMPNEKAEATRSLSGKMINLLKDKLPNLIGRFRGSGALQ